MSKPTEATLTAVRRRRRAALVRGSLPVLPIVAGVLLIVQADLTQAGLTAPKADAEAQGEITYQVRCWQQGRLLFEENDVQLPADMVSNGLKLRGTDRSKAPIYVTETQNATCLVRRTSLRKERGRP